MSEQQNLEIVKRGYEAFGRGDTQALLDLFADDIEWSSPGPPELPTAGNRRGRQQVAEFFQAVDQIFEIQQFEPKTFLAQGDLVVVLGTDTARIKASGKVVTDDWAHAFTVRGGKIVKMREYIDTSAVVAELNTAQART
jgi:uncharacterized protein